LCEPRCSVDAIHGTDIEDALSYLRAAQEGELGQKLGRTCGLLNGTYQIWTAMKGVL
jgi:hypothetical protein